MSTLALMGAGPESGSAFSPLSLSPSFWVKADTLGLSDGTTVGTGVWTDQSGNGRDLAVTAGQEPTFKTAIQNGQPVVRFAGAQAMQTANVALSSAQPTTIFVVAAISDLTATRTLVDGFNSATARNIVRLGSGTQWELYSGTSVLGGAEDSAWHVFTGVFNGASSELRIDRTQVLTGSAGTQFLSNGLRLGVAQDGSTNRLIGDLGEVLVCPTPSTTDRDAFEAALKIKWGTP